MIDTMWMAREIELQPVTLPELAGRDVLVTVARGSFPTQGAGSFPTDSSAAAGDL